jgi:hypothetical protein
MAGEVVVLTTAPLRNLWNQQLLILSLEASTYLGASAKLRWRAAGEHSL